MTATRIRTGPTPRADSEHGHSARASARSWQPSALMVLVLGNAVSMTGNVMITVAVPWLVLTTTGSAALAGISIFAGVVSATVGGLAAGRAVDAIGAVRASSVADLVSGLAVAPLPVLLALDVLHYWEIVLMTVLGTLADAAGSAARQGMVAATADAGRHRRERANAWFTSAEHVGYLLGAPAAGLLIARLGVGAALGVSVGCFALAALAVLRLGNLRVAHDVREVVQGAGLRETLAFIWSNRALRALVVFPTMAVLLVGPLASLVLPVLARVVFDDPVVLGVMVAAYGIGGLLGAAAYGVLGHRRSQRSLYVGIFVVWPSTYAVVLLVPAMHVTLVMLLVLGAAAGSLVPLQATIRQQHSPPRLLPRVVALSTASIPVAAPTGALVTGFLIDALGLGQACALLAVAAGVVGVGVVISPWTRHLEEGRGIAAEESFDGTGAALHGEATRQPL